jgi:hypothetical protein
MRRTLAVVAALVSAFFVFYFVRLLVVTGFLRHVRAGGGGAYVGAVVFPLVAAGLAWAAVRLWGRAAAPRRPTA